MSPDRSLAVLLVSQPGIMHNTLHSILQSLPNVKVSDATGALTAFEFLERQQIDVVVIDANIPLAERLALLERAKKHFPYVRCVVVTITTKNHHLLTMAGADGLLLRDCLPQDMEAVMLGV